MNSFSKHSSSLTRRDFIAGAVALGATALTEPLCAQTASPQRFLGPILGHGDETTAMVWSRTVAQGELTLEITPVAGGKPRLWRKKASAKNDFCMHWQVTGLMPETEYRYRILQGDKAIAAEQGQVFRTAPKVDAPAKVRLAISSCAKEDEGSRAVWKRMASEQVDAVVLIGDTPYIDSTDLEKQSLRHREFAAVPEYQALLKTRPCWWTWDDHDFAGNDASGLASGKENSRLVFSRYRPQPAYGDGSGGIYTSFRRGPVEVFLLDTRWYSMTEPSFAASHKPTLLGAAQWEWLQKGLLASTAPFKLLASGMIWDDKENTESDDWGTYKHELAAIRKFIGEHRVPGVIFVGGDIHASRVLRYNTAKTVGYDLVQFIASPIHANTLAALNVPNPDLIRSAVEPNVFLRVDADSTVTPAELHATLINKQGETVFSYHLTADELKPKK
jgi:alkaline phosphatase D